MRRVALVGFLLSALTAPAEAVLLKADITYTNGQIVSGPLPPDLTELPASVVASFVLDVSAVPPFVAEVGIQDVLTASLVFGDVAWDLSHLQTFDSLIDTGGSLGEFFLTSLTYDFDEVCREDQIFKIVYCRLAQNFPLEITGTITTTGEQYHYVYTDSFETVTEVPEPSSLALVTFGFAGLAAWRSRLGRNSRRSPGRGPRCARPRSWDRWHVSPVA